MKLGIVAAPAHRGPVVRLAFEGSPQATVDRRIAAERRARLARAASVAAFRRALRAVLRAVA